MIGVDKRSNARFDVDLTVTVTRADAEFDGRMVNLSLGGALLVVELEPPASVGEDIGVRFSVPTLDAPIEARARVRWRAEHDATAVGVQFTTGFRAKQTWALGRYLDQLADQAGA